MLFTRESSKIENAMARVSLSIIMAGSTRVSGLTTKDMAVDSNGSLMATLIKGSL